jgi:hypothetical protein
MKIAGNKLSKLIEQARNIDMRGGLGHDTHAFLRDLIGALVLAEFALTPFAEEVDRWEEMGNSRSIATDTSLTVRDLRRAASALED